MIDKNIPLVENNFLVKNIFDFFERVKKVTLQVGEIPFDISFQMYLFHTLWRVFEIYSKRMVLTT